MYKNAASKEVVEMEKQFPGDFSKIAHLMKGELYRQSFHETGNTDVCAPWVSVLVIPVGFGTCLHGVNSRYRLTKLIPSGGLLVKKESGYCMERALLELICDHVRAC